MRSKHSPTVREKPTFIEARRREQIIACAIDAVAELGYERASLAEIAKRARISKSVISYYFASKDDLMDQVVSHVYAEATAFMLPQIQAERTAGGAVRALITSNVAFIGEHRREVQALVEIISSARTPDGLPRFDVRGLEQPIADIDHLLRLGQASGEFGKFSTEVTAVAIRQAIDALGPRLKVYPDIDVDEYGEELAALFERAVRKRK
jgi:AcrR family transcriptional regulator